MNTLWEIYVSLIKTIFMTALLFITGCLSPGSRGRRQDARQENTGHEYRRETNSDRRANNTDETHLALMGANSSPVVADSNEQTNLSLLYGKCKSAVFLIYTSTNTETYQGTGFFVSPDGIAVSNYHVFMGTWKGLEEIKLATGEVLKIEKIFSCSNEDDFIVFKVKTNKNRPWLPVANKEPVIGEDVFAIGNPHGLEHTLSTGIISGYHRADNLIQIGVPITHGSSGGPLLNMKGEVIGVTTSGMGEANLNFAIDIRALNLRQYTGW